MEEEDLTPAEVHLMALMIEMKKYGQDYFAEHAGYILQLMAHEKEGKMNKTSIAKLPTHKMPLARHRGRSTEQSRAEKMNRAQANSLSKRTKIPITLKAEPWSVAK